MTKKHQKSTKKTTAPKNQKKLYIPREERYLRGVSLMVIGFLELFMAPTLAVRLVSILFIAAGMSNARVSLLVDCSQKTVLKLRRRMDTETVESLMVIKKGSGRKAKAPRSVLEAIVDMVKNGLFSSLQQIVDMIKAEYSLTLSCETVPRILKRFSIRKLKCGSLPIKADPQKQRDCYNGILLQLMEKAEKGDSVLVFMDASHFVMGCDFQGCFYSLHRRFVKTLSGRKRYNVLGAMNFVSKDVHTVTNSSYITYVQVCRMLVKIAKAYKGQEIHVVLDNAAYQRCKAVQMVAERLKIDLVFLPPYSPNLNLIERFWKFTKSELRTKFYSNFSEFCGSCQGSCQLGDLEN